MISRSRRWLRKLRRWVVGTLAVSLVLGATLVALLSQLLPLLNQHPQQVASWLQRQIQQPVELTAVDARWSRSGPLLRLHGLKIGADTGHSGLELSEAELLVRVYAGWWPGQPLLSIRLAKPELDLQRLANGGWELQGLGPARPGGLQALLAQIEQLGELRIDEASLAISDVASGRHFELPRIDARLRTVGGRVRVGVRVYAATSAPLQLIADLDPGLGAGRLYLGSDAISLHHWLADSLELPVHVRRGEGRVAMWAHFDEGGFDDITLQATLRDLQLHGSPVAASGDVVGGEHSTTSVAMVDDPATSEGGVRWSSDEIEVMARAWRVGDDWRVVIPAMHLRQGKTERHVRGVEWGSAGGRSALFVEQVDLLALFEWLPILGGDLPPLPGWLRDAAPSGTVESLHLSLLDNQFERASGVIRDLSWLPVGTIPGVSGFGAQFDGDAEQLRISLESPNFIFSAPLALAAPISANVHGELALYPREQGWVIEAVPLQIQGGDFAADVEGSLWWQNDGSRPFLDVRAVGAAGTPVTAAKHFWVLNKMPPKTVEWLNRGLVDGHLNVAQALVHGDLDHWPFDHAEGRFEAYGEVEGVTLDYLPGWPRGQQLAGWVRFLNMSMQAEVSGEVLGSKVDKARGTFGDLRHPVLALQLAGKGSGEGLLGLIRQSPLQKRFGAAIEGLSVGGHASVDVDMQVPLKSELGSFQLAGHADLHDADLAESRWGLQFQSANGRLRFTEAGFSADELNVLFADQLTSLSLAVGQFTSTEQHVAEGSLRGRVSIDSLLALRPEMDWLRPHVEGVSEWSARVTMPRVTDGAHTVSVRLQSDLEGTALQLPSPLRKAASERLPADVELMLPSSSGRIDLQLGELLHLRGRLGERASDFRGIAAFGVGELSESPSQSGLEVVGSVPVLDGNGWVAATLSGLGQGAQVRRIDLSAGILQLGGRDFSDSRVQVERQDDGSGLVRFAGERLQGELRWPQQWTDATLVGRFDRLHWPSAPPGETDVPADDVDPVWLPALDFDIDDARLGDAQLGAVQLQTVRTADGLQLANFTARSDDLSISASGDWSRRIEGSESRFKFQFSGADLGRMMQKLGFATLVEGGATQAVADVNWRGGPAQFQMSTLEGQLRIDVKKGRVPNVEPGAGRIIGLLSLTEIPRRLTLDFSDFFASGFAFNSIEGDFRFGLGNAVTDNLVIESPSAQIRIAGRTGLSARDYDQTMEVLPRTNNVLPAIGALSAGPAGAAIGAVAQAVLQKPMRQMARTLYHVGGSWDASEIAVLERGPRQPSPAGEANTEMQ